MNSLDANFYEVYQDLVQKSEGPVNASLLRYPWDESYEALQKSSNHSPFDGIVREYTNPVTGGPVMPTIGAQLQLLQPGEETKAHHHTGSVICQVAKGRGWSIVGGQRFDWEEKDIFCVPSWSPHSHANASATDDACLFPFNDLPAMKSLHLYREQST